MSQDFETAADAVLQDAVRSEPGVP